MAITVSGARCPPAGSMSGWGWGVWPGRDVLQGSGAVDERSRPPGLRCGPGHPVTRAITHSAAGITAAAARTAARLAGRTARHTAGPPPRRPEHSPAGRA